MKFLRFLVLLVFVIAAWYVLSGMADAFHLGVGVVVSIVITAAFFPWKSERPFPVLRFLAFIPWEIWQILLSNYNVARLVLKKNPPIAPRFILRKPLLKSDEALTLLGCAITLTPGTLTVDITRDQLLVHALDAASAKSIDEDVMTHKVDGVFREAGS